MTSPSDSDDIASIIDLQAKRRPDPTEELFLAARNEAEVEGADDDLLASLATALPDPPRWLRITIAALASAQLIIVLPWLVDTDPFGLLGTSTGSHLARDGGLGLAVAVAAILTAWRPRWALPSFLIASAALIAQAVAGFIDNEDGTGANEFIHVPSVVLACLIGLSSIRLGDLRPTRRSDAGSSS